MYVYVLLVGELGTRVLDLVIILLFIYFLSYQSRQRLFVTQIKQESAQDNQRID